MREYLELQSQCRTPREPDVTTDLSREIVAWDGKSVAALQSTYQRHGNEGYFVATVLAHVADVNLQRAATWLLKRYLEAGNPLSAGDCRAILASLSGQEHWEAKLHVLQCLPYLEIPEEARVSLETFLDDCVKSDRKFVRAWAYNGFNELSLRFPQYRERVNAMVTEASKSEAASVRARIRNMPRNH